MHHCGKIIREYDRIHRGLTVAFVIPLLLCAGVILMATAASANPAGGTVVSGSASITGRSLNENNIASSSPRFSWACHCHSGTTKESPLRHSR